MNGSLIIQKITKEHDHCHEPGNTKHDNKINATQLDKVDDSLFNNTVRK